MALGDGVDPKCYELAEHFLCRRTDEADLSPVQLWERRHALAGAIQRVVDLWMETEDVPPHHLPES